MKRRNFLSESGRWLLLGGLAGASGLLLHRRRFGDPEKCFANPFCRSCNQLAACHTALNAKTNKHEVQQGK
jgi:hypothetical protein